MCHVYPVAKLSADLLIILIGTIFVSVGWRITGKHVAIDRTIRDGTALPW
jgi:hypothetical protein